MSTPVLLLVAFFSGCAFAVVGLSYRWGQSRQIAPAHIVGVLSLIGMIWFARKAWGTPPASVPVVIWGMALAAGTLQFVAIKLITVALRKGPISPPWCMCNLGFLPVIVYAFLTWGEPVGPWQMAGMAAGVLCVICSAWAQSPPEGSKPAAQIRPLHYGLLMVALLLANSLSIACIKDLGCRCISVGDPRKMIDVFGPFYLSAFYGFLGACVLGESLLLRRYPRRIRLTTLTGLVAAGGSIGGMSMFAACSHYPAVIWAIVAGMSGIAVTAIVSVVAFGERLSLAWAGMLLFALLSVLLVAM